jgi:hypothetical protein
MDLEMNQYPWPGTKMHLEEFILVSCTRVTQKVFQPFLYFIQNQQEISAFFSVVSNECTFVTAVPWGNTFSCTCGVGHQNGVVW